MAVDKLVDSTKLDACLDAEADAIRAKTGGSANIPFDFANNKGFADAIAAIPSGGLGFNPLDYMSGAFFQNVKNYPEDEVSVNLVSRTECSQVFRDSKFTKVTLSSQNPISSFNLCFAACTASYIDVSGVLLASSVNWDGAFIDIAHSPKHETVIGVDFTGASIVDRCFESCTVLQNLTFKPNTSAISIDLHWSSLLSNESLVSIANGLVSGSHTLTLHATPKAKCSQITGTVSSVTDGTGTYDFFTADANGTVSLMDFITTVKGWTVA